MPHIKDHPIRWEMWNTIFISLTVFKRDKLEEIELSLMALYYEFAVQLQDAEFSDLLKITNSMMTSDKLMNYVNGCKVSRSTFRLRGSCRKYFLSVRRFELHRDDHQVGASLSEVR